MEGLIHTFKAEKRFGFIQAEDGASYFFHCSALDNKRDEEHLTSGLRVQFTPAMAAKGPRGEDIKLLERSRIAYDPLSEPFRTFKDKAPGHFDTHDISTWEISAAHRYLSHAKDLLQARAANIGANAMLYYKVESRGGRPGKRPDEHVVSGVPATVSEQGLRLKQQKLTIDQRAGRRKAMAMARVSLVVATCLGSIYWLYPQVGPLALGLLIPIPVFLGDHAWLKRRKRRKGQ